jgi:prephenate dehydrogenase
LIGASLSLALKRAGYAVDGFDQSPSVNSYALQHHIVCQIATDYTAYDCVLVALPPKATISFLTETTFQNGAIVADICGVKAAIEAAVYARERSYFYVGLHPMAGKEVSGIQNAEETLFDKASMVITHHPQTSRKALTTIKELVKEMGFAAIVECSAKVHDQKIAYTSQLAHIVSNAYVKDEEICNCLGFTGGSFQDMTRIAGVDEKVWSELYLLNGKEVCEKISALVKHLNEIQAAVQKEDRAALEAVLREGRIQFESAKEAKPDEEDIVVTRLK